MKLRIGPSHEEAGTRYPAGEMSFRQTIYGQARSDRGFMVVIDRAQQKVLSSFDAGSVQPRHGEWLASVGERGGLGELDPQPYWGFADLEHKAGTKLLNTFYVQAEVKVENGVEFYRYSRVTSCSASASRGFCGHWNRANCSSTSTREPATTTAPNSGCGKTACRSCMKALP